MCIRDSPSCSIKEPKIRLSTLPVRKYLSMMICAFFMVSSLYGANCMAFFCSLCIYYFNGIRFFYQFFSSDIVDFFSDNDYSKKMVKGVRSMNFHESADRDFSIQFCEYNYSNPDYDQIYRCLLYTSVTASWDSLSPWGGI